MEIEKLVRLMELASKLKYTPRHCWLPDGSRESVAAHSWRAALMAYFLKDEFKDADMNRVMLMCLLHDMGEAFTGDIPAFYKTGADEARESDLLSAWTESLDEPYRGELNALYAEIKAQDTVESRIFKAIDRLEAVQSHNESDISTWLPLERTLNLTYGTENTAWSDYLTALRRYIRVRSEEKLEKAGLTSGATGSQ